MTDQGKKPFVTNIEDKTLGNTLFRDTLWTGEHLQLTVMSIPVGGDIGLEVHPNTDQFLRIEQGSGKCEMGQAEDDLNFVRDVADDDIIMVPAGVWHNVTNVGDTDMKLYTLYGPPDHVPGTQHGTQKDAQSDPNEH